VNKLFRRNYEMKRALSIVLLFVMLATTYVPSLVYAAETSALLEYLTTNTASDATEEGTPSEGDGSAITRIAWLQSLVTVFDYTIDSGVVIDNYYSDLDETSEHYETVMIAVYHGLIDALPNQALCLEEPATREFAAHTLNACMGYLIDGEGYTYSEQDAVTYQMDIQVAIDREWFALVDGAFLPEQPITSAEKEIMLADAAEYLAGMQLDSTHENMYTFYEDVIVLNDAAEITAGENGSVITIQNCSETIAVGNKFVVFQQGLAVPYMANNVTTDGDYTIITAEALDFHQAIESMDVQSTMSALPTNFYAAEDTELIFVEETTGEVYESAAAALRAMRANSWAVIVPKFSKKIPLGDAISLSLNVELKNTVLNLDSKLGKKSYCNIWLDTDAEVSGTLSCDLTKAFGDGIEIYVGGYTIPDVGGLGLYFKIDMTGAVTVVQKYHLKVGIKVGYDLGKGKMIKDLYCKLKEQGSSLNAEISAKIYLEAKFGIYGKALPVEGYLYAEAGFAAKVKYTTYEAIAGSCVHFAAYFYAEYGAKVEWDFGISKDSLTWSKDYYDESNSPIKISIHYEDGKQVDSCTRTDLIGTSTGQSSPIGDSGYTTRGNSRYALSGLISAGSSTGSGSSGKPIVLYEYELNDKKEATITEYHGNASSLTIPLYLDGYPVIAIGNGAFQNKTSLTTVVMQSNILTIDARAFEGCRNLRNVTFSDNLTFIGDGAFGNCRSLTTAILPDSVTTIEDNVFRECAALQYVRLPANLTHLGRESFYNCDALTSIEIPAKIEIGGDYYGGAFAGCDNLRNVTFAEGITYIPRYMFKYCAGLETITIPDTVTVIGERAFESAVNLKQVLLSKNLLTIDSSAFVNCSSLAAIELPEGLTEIAYEVFGNCTSLKAIEIPDSVTTIGQGAFRECTELASVKLSVNLMRLDRDAFYNCDALTSIEIPAKLEVGGDYYGGAFAGCDNLKTVTFAEGISHIPSYLFKYCVGLETITIPDTVTVIGERAFESAVNLKEVNFSKNLLTIDSNAFVSCDSLAEIELPDTLTEINHEAFGNCTSLKEIEIPDSVTTIGQGAFRECTKLESVKLSANLIHLDRDAFYNCDALTSIEIPAKLEVGGDFYGGAFAGCDNLKTVTFAEGITYIPSYLFKYCPGIETIAIPDTVTSIGERAFESAANLKEVTFSKNLITIGNNAFVSCSSLATVEFPDSLTKIEYEAFGNCTSLQTIIIPDSVTIIEDGAFKKCTELVSVKLSSNLASLGREAFGDCDLLESIEIPATLEVGGDFYNGAFAGCDNLKTVTFAEGITLIPEYLFKNCTGIETIVIPDTVTVIGNRAFERCTNLKEITLSQNLAIIEDNAFEACTALTEIILPDTVTEMGSSVFYGCTVLTSAKWSAGMTTIPNSTFNGCSSLAAFVIPEGVKTIGNYAFHNCLLMANVTFPSSLVTIENDAFNNCDALTSVVLPFGVKTISYRVFYDCDALESVEMDNSVTEIGGDTFNSCDSLKNVKLSLKLTKISSNLFRDCASLEEIVIPYFVTTIEGNAFNASPKLSKVVTGEKLKNISTNAFSYPNKTVFYGKVGSYTETWANNNGYTFTENTTAATSVILRENTLTLAKGKNAQLNLAIDPADFADSITFKSSNTNIVTVDENGNIRAVGVGTATIKVIVGKASASCKITVTQAITRISINAATRKLNVPETYQLSVAIFPEDASNKVLLWTSSNENVATVDENGLVTAIGNGVAIITATTTDGTNHSVSCTVTVIDPNNIPVTSIKLNRTDLTLNALDVAQLVATVAPNDAANKALIWTSSDESVATVDENGVITAIGKGNAVITVTAADGYGASATCNVTVTNTAHIVTDVESLESPHPYEDSCKDIWVYTVDGAQALIVTFDENTYMEDGFDFLHVYDANGTLIGTYTGSELAGVTLKLDGNSIRIRMEADDSGNEWGFKVVSVEVITCVHNYIGETLDPTCTEQGYTTYTCELCGDSYIDDITEPHGHKEQVTVLEPTCTEEGTETVTCAICGILLAENTIPPAGHTEGEWYTVIKPTCTEDGLSAVSCVSCGVELDTASIPATGHKMGEWYFVIEPTCTEDGLQQCDCVICGCSDKAIANKLGHDIVAHDAQAPTCTEKGWEAYETCTRCDYTTYVELSATGHSYEGGVCTACGALECIYGDANGDGKVNGMDATRLLRYLAFFDPATGESTLSVTGGADTNGDGKINGMDATRLLRYLAFFDPTTGESSVKLGP